MRQRPCRRRRRRLHFETAFVEVCSFVEVPPQQLLTNSTAAPFRSDEEDLHRRRINVKQVTPGTHVQCLSLLPCPRLKTNILVGSGAATGQAGRRAARTAAADGSQVAAGRVDSYHGIVYCNDNYFAVA